MHASHYCNNLTTMLVVSRTLSKYKDSLLLLCSPSFLYQKLFFKGFLFGLTPALPAYHAASLSLPPEHCAGKINLFDTLRMVCQDISIFHEFLQYSSLHVPSDSVRARIWSFPLSIASGGSNRIIPHRGKHHSYDKDAYIQGILISISNNLTQHMDLFHYNLLVLKLE